MKALALALVVVAFAACGGKKNAADSKAIDNYVNVELAPQLAKVVAARSAYGNVKATDIDDQPAKMKWLFRDIAAPFLAQAVTSASSITPPAGAKEVHEAALSLWKKERDIIGAMAAATEPVDADKFKAAHQQMMDLQESVMSWDRKLQALLDSSGGLKLKPLPDVKIPAPNLDEPEAPAAPAGRDKPPLCKDGTDTAELNGDIACETELMFSPPETPAGTPKDNVVACGPGELIVDKTGKIKSCVSFAKVVVGDTTLDKGTKIKFGDNASVIAATPPDGKQLCFDGAGKQTACP